MTTTDDTHDNSVTSSPMVLSSKHLVDRQMNTEVELSPTLLAAIDDGALPTPGFKITNCYGESSSSYLPMPPLGFILTDQMGGIGVVRNVVTKTWKYNIPGMSGPHGIPHISIDVI
jgi:hypothetical protein